jgi:hypothetical protein
MFTLRLGRQALYNGVGSGVFDGFNLKFYQTGFTISGFYGGNVPAYQKMEFTNDLKNDYILNGKVVITALENFRFTLNYVDKNFKAKDYITTRLDENLNPINVLIQQKSNQFEFVTGKITYDLPETINITTRYDYDINFKTSSRFELLANYTELDDFNFNIYYNYREPRIRYNSIFAVFNYANTQEIEGGLDYKINQIFTVAGKFGYVNYEDDNSQRITVALNSNFGNVSYRKTFGYAGELDAISVYTAKSYFEGLITPSIGLSYTSYKLSEDSDKNSLFTFLGGLNIRPFNTLSLDLQGQYLNNKIYKNDFRVLAKINYWFNSNL